MPRAALTLEVLAKQWRLGRVDALAICGHPHGRVPVPGAARASQTDRWFYCLYGRREGQWEVVREAHNSSLRGRTWWSLDQCLRALERRQVVPQELRLLPRGPAPADFPKLPVETAPTESARRQPAARPPAAMAASSPRTVGWLDGVGESAGARQSAAPGDDDDHDADEWGDEEEGGGGSIPG
jgi:hypothetical protein